MRTFFRDHWKVLVAIILLVLLALFTVSPSAAIHAPSPAERLRAHVTAIAPAENDAPTPAGLGAAARYIENALRTEGYDVQRQESPLAHDIEAAVANVKPGTKPARIFIIGAHYGKDSDSGSDTAAVLELAHLLKDLRPSQDTEVRFVFFVDAGRPYAGRPCSGSFIAFVGTLASSRLVQDSLAAFRSAADLPAHGLAAPAYVQGITLSGHPPYHRPGDPAIMITDTAFMRYPYYKMHDPAEDTPDRIDYESTARVLSGLARTITALASGASD